MKKMASPSLHLFIAALLALAVNVNNAEAFSSREVKCLVCKATVAEMESAIQKLDPKKKVEVSGFRMDAAGNSVGKTVPYSKSEMYLTELMETICDKMDDYAKATYKSNGRLTVLKFMVESGMNPEISQVDFVQDGDLNKSLKHFCLEILEDHEENVLKHFMSDSVDNIDIKLCTDQAKYCDDVSDDDNDVDRDEL